MTNRRRARELCLQSLYLSDLTQLSPEKLLVITQEDPTRHEKKVFEFYKKLFMTSMDSMGKIDEVIKGMAKNWDLDRMAAVDRAVLRLAVCEMVILKEAPLPVIIDEAIELAKMYSTDNSGKFVNGVLDSIARALPGAALKSKVTRTVKAKPSGLVSQRTTADTPQRSSVAKKSKAPRATKTSKKNHDGK